MEDRAFLSEYNIQNKSTLDLVLRMKRWTEINVRTLKGDIIILDVTLFDTIVNIKQKIKAKNGIPVMQQSLFFDGRQLDDGATLSDYRIKYGSNLDLIRCDKESMKQAIPDKDIMPPVKRAKTSSDYRIKYGSNLDLIRCDKESMKQAISDKDIMSPVKRAKTSRDSKDNARNFITKNAGSIFHLGPLRFLSQPSNVMVDEAAKKQDDSIVGFGQAKLDKLNLFAGDLVLIKGNKGRSTIVNAVPDATVEDHKMRMGKVVRNNLRLQLGDVAHVQAAPEVKYAKAITVAPYEEDLKGLAEGTDLFETFLKPYFAANHRPLRLDNTFVTKADTKAVEFKVTRIDDVDTEDVNYCIVVAGTKINVKETQIRRLKDEKRNETGYDDIGDCVRQLSQIRELIELPPRHSEIKCPGNHELVPPLTTNKYTCNVCHQKGLRRSRESLYCAICDFHVCTACTRSNKTAVLETWTCQVCTLVNQGSATSCEACGIPRNFDMMEPAGTALQFGAHQSPGPHLHSKDESEICNFQQDLKKNGFSDVYDVLYQSGISSYEMCRHLDNEVWTTLQNDNSHIPRTRFLIVKKYISSKYNEGLLQLPEGKKYHCFASHEKSTGSDNIAMHIVDFLRQKYKFQAFFDVDDLRQKEINCEQLSLAVKDSCVLIAILDNHVLESPYCRHEWESARLHKVPIVAVFDCDSYDNTDRGRIIGEMQEARFGYVTERRIVEYTKTYREVAIQELAEIITAAASS